MSNDEQDEFFKARHCTRALLMNFNNALINGDRDTLHDTLKLTQHILHINNVRSETCAEIPIQQADHIRSATRFEFKPYDNRMYDTPDKNIYIPLADTHGSRTDTCGFIVFSTDGDPREYTITTQTELGNLEINTSVDKNNTTIRCRNALPNTMINSIHTKSKHRTDVHTQTYYQPNQLTLDERVQLTLWISLLRLLEREEQTKEKTYASDIKITHMSHADVISLIINDTNDEHVATIQTIIPYVTRDIDRHFALGQRI